MNCPLCQNQNTHVLLQEKDASYWRCSECYLTFLAPENRLSQDLEKKRYETHQNHPEDQGYRNFLSRLMNPLLEKLEPGWVGLDFGCGPGPTLSVMLEEKGYLVDLYDPYFYPNSQVLKKTYDFVTCTETIEHFFAPGDEFKRLQSLLRVQGWLGIMTEQMPEDEEFLKWYYRKDPTHVSFYRPETLVWIANRFDWKLEIVNRTVSLFQRIK